MKPKYFVPDEWQGVVDDVGDVLRLASGIARQHYPGGTIPAGTIPALVIVLAFAGCVRVARKR